MWYTKAQNKNKVELTPEVMEDVRQYMSPTDIISWERFQKMKQHGRENIPSYYIPSAYKQMYPYMQIDPKKTIPTMPNFFENMYYLWKKRPDIYQQTPWHSKAAFKYQYLTRNKNGGTAVTAIKG